MKIAKIKDSSFVSSIAYDAKTKTLSVLFKSGRTYQYEGVGASIARAFASAESKGRFYNEKVRGSYESRELVAGY